MCVSFAGTLNINNSDDLSEAGVAELEGSARLILKPKFRHCPGEI